jgi:type I restriction enzyme S subunit
MEPRFLEWYLLSPAAQADLDAMKTGISDSGLNLTRGRFLALAVPVPPLDDQRRIVEVLEGHLSRLDAACAYLMTASTRQARLIDRYLSSRLTQISPPVRPLDEVLGEPLANGRSVPTSDQGFPVLRLTAINAGRIDLDARKTGAWTATEAAPFLVRKGDFLISRGNGSRHLVGRGGLVFAEPDPVAFPDTLVRIRARADLVDPEFLALIWNGSNVRQQIETAAKTTAGIYKINQKDVQRILLPLPTLQQQIALASQVSAFRASVERLALAQVAGTRRGKALRRALLGAAFSGKLSVRAIGLDQRRYVADV